MRPTDKRLARDAGRPGKGDTPPHSDQPTGSPGLHWLDEFMIREGILRDPVSVLGDQNRLGQAGSETRDAAYEPMPEDDAITAPSRRWPAAIGAAALLLTLGLGSLGAVWWSHVSHRARPHIMPTAVAQPTRRGEAVEDRRPPAEPMPSSAPPDQMRSIERALLKSVPAPLWGDTAAGFPGYPQVAFGRPPDALSDGPGALMLAAAMSSVARPPLLAKVTSPPRHGPPTPEPAAVAQAPLTESGPKPVTERPPATPVPARDDLPVGTPIHLQIVYASSGPEEARTIAALAAQLQGQMKTIATVGTSEWPVRHEAILYFFPNDRTAASLVAASLAQITERTAPIMLLRTKSAPQPGTVDILLPLRNPEDFKKDDLQR
jgi:hypothetical protein